MNETNKSSPGERRANLILFESFTFYCAGFNDVLGQNLKIRQLFEAKLKEYKDLSKVDGLDSAKMTEYLLHHLRIAGIKDMLYDEASVLAIHQGSGGILRKANFLARGTLLLAAVLKNSKLISAEHVRLAATELL